MSASDEFLTIAEPCEITLKVRGSTFIGNVHPVSDRQAAEAILKAREKEYFDATHHCFAYRIGLPPLTVERFSDAGEPSGTAGKPILQAIQGRNLTDCIVIVTRYFGGTKLGTGGLARAYGGTASDLLDRAPILTRVLTQRIHIRFDYADTSAVMHLIQRCAGKIVESTYDSHSHLTVDVRLREMETFKTELVNCTRGTAEIS